MLTSGIKDIIVAVGYAGLFAIVFSESGLFFGFFLPGDSLLVTAGLLATQGYFNIIYLIPLLALAAITGDSTGYWFGKKFGPRIFKKDKSFFFDKKHIQTASGFYEKHGVKTIIIARFVPYVRTFAPIVAGIGGMEYSKFLTFNIAGGITWTTLMLLIGYFLGSAIPNVDKYLIPIIAIIIVISFIPTAFENRKHIARETKKVFAKLKI